jgi:hypothetical protein
MRTVDKLWSHRRREILDIVRVHPGPTTGRVERRVRDRLIQGAIRQAEASLEGYAIREFDRLITGQTNRRRRPWIRRKGRMPWGKLEVFVNRFYHQLSSKNQVYVFWKRRHCLYVGQTKRDVLGGGGKWKASLWRDCTSLQMFSTNNERDLSKFECLAIHVLRPERNRYRPPQSYYRSRCPVHRRTLRLSQQLKRTFAFRKV